MLGINNKDISDMKLRDEVSKYSMLDSKPKKDGEEEGNVDMGFYFNGLDILEFDTGVLPEEEPGMTRASSQAANSWQDWWSLKQKQNDQLKEAIIQNNAEKVKELLKEEMDQRNADVNCTLHFMDF
jgi:hypothetical protein